LAEARREHPDSLSSQRWTATVRSTLVTTHGRTVLVDSGIGTSDRAYARALGTGGCLPDLLEEVGVARTDIDLVVITHVHADHVGWNLEGEGAIARAVFPKARYVIHPAAWAAAVSDAAHPEAGMRFFEENVGPLADLGVLDLAAGGVEVAHGVRLVDAPGHTPGHLLVHIESREEHALILGDAAVHPLQLTLPQAGFVFDEDPLQAAHSRRVIVEQALAHDALVTGAHFPGSGFGRLQSLGGRHVWREIAD
jgi:glyoxylase-like metal-dependent hydrolase (beta-lactamase superfamily II)